MIQSKIPQFSLYVGDLHPDVTESILYEKFSSYGNLLSIRVCRDLKSKRSLGYAYVNFENKDQALSAMKMMNSENIYGQPCRIMWSNRDPTTRNGTVGNIVIKNLDKEITAKKINKIFSKYGEISSCKLQTNKKGDSTGVAFVNFSNENDADKAIQATNGTLIGNQNVYVGKFAHKNETFTNCYIKNFGNDLDDESLRQLFQKYGQVLSAKVMVDDHGAPEGFGFVSFKRHEDALRAVEALNGKNIKDNKIYVGRFMNKIERQIEHTRQMKATEEKKKQSVNLYIKNLGSEVNDNILMEMFGNFGKIISAKVMLNENRTVSQGYGFVCFSTEKEASKAITEMNGKIFNGKPLYVSKAMKKEEQSTSLKSNRSRESQTVSFNPSMSRNSFVRPYGNITTTQSSKNLPINTDNQNIAQNPYNRFTISYGQMNQLKLPYGKDINTISCGLNSMPDDQNKTLSKSMEQKHFLLAKLCPSLKTYAGDLARNVYEMFSRLDKVELSEMIQNERVLKSKVDEALIVLRDQNHIVQNQSTLQRIAVLNGEAISQISSMELKQSLGEKLYPEIKNRTGSMAGKVTGMLLELENQELHLLIENKHSLQMKIDEALHLIQSSGQGRNREQSLYKNGYQIKVSQPSNQEFGPESMRERIYGTICKYAGDKAGKVTEMLLILGDDELVKMNEDALKAKTEKILALLSNPSSYKERSCTISSMEDNISQDLDSAPSQVSDSEMSDSQSECVIGECSELNENVNTPSSTEGDPVDEQISESKSVTNENSQSPKSFDEILCDVQYYINHLISMTPTRPQVKENESQNLKMKTEEFTDKNSQLFAKAELDETIKQIEDYVTKLRRLFDG